MLFNFSPVILIHPPLSVHVGARFRENRPREREGREKEKEREQEGPKKEKNHQQRQTLLTADRNGILDLGNKYTYDLYWAFREPIYAWSTAGPDEITKKDYARADIQRQSRLITRSPGLKTWLIKTIRKIRRAPSLNPSWYERCVRPLG